MSARTDKRYAIGLDCGKQTGFSVWDRAASVFTNICTLDFWEAFDTIVNIWGADQCVVLVEDPAQNRPVFHRHYKQAAQDKISSNVGMVKRESTLMIEGLRRRGYEVVAVKPTRGKVKDPAYFNKLTGWKGRTSQHGRDSALLAWRY